MEHSTLLSVRNLHMWYELRQRVFGRAGYVRAVDGVTFDLAEGEAVAVVGESGCGKSSLAKTILGLYRPSQGELFFQGEPIHTANAQKLRWYRSQVGFVQQDPYGALPPFMNVRRILEEPLIIHGIRKAQRQERIHEVLEEVKLVPIDDFITKFPHMLSGGQQQRVVVARAMLLRPKLIVADEPVSMLDASVRVEILELLRSLQSAHRLAVLYITHDLSAVRHSSERIFVMYGGRIVEKASVADLLRNPLHPYTRALLRAIPDADAANAETYREVPPGEPPSLLHPPAGCRFHPRCPLVNPGLCDTQEPPEFEPEPQHHTLCWLYKDKTP
jgi:peptide/nickel transport system ATP-binding protein